MSATIFHRVVDCNSRTAYTPGSERVTDTHKSVVRQQAVLRPTSPWLPEDSLLPRCERTICTSRVLIKHNPAPKSKRPDAADFAFRACPCAAQARGGESPGGDAPPGQPARRPGHGPDPPAGPHAGDGAYMLARRTCRPPTRS